MSRPALVCSPAGVPYAPSSPAIRARVRFDLGEADVSRLTGRELAAIFGQAQERESHLLDQARAESPADDYAIIERFLMLFEAEEGEPFRL